ncbi:MAG: signal peptidase II [Anaerolineae bacterium]
MKIWAKLLLAGSAVFFVDLASKIWAEQNLEPFQPVEIIGDFFRLTLGYNTGVAFGMMSNGGMVPLVLTGVIIAGLIFWFTRGLYSGQFPERAAWPIGMLLGGAIGNFLDRLPDGRVTDFLDVGLGELRWPTFNLADSFILIGVALLVLATFNHVPEPQPQYEESVPENSY